MKCTIKWKLFIRVLTIFPYFLTINGEGIVCYKCTTLPPPAWSKEPNQICSQFDGSARFQVFCPKSTLCAKKTFHFSLANGTTITSVQRDCASQKNRVQTYNYAEKKWYSNEEVVQTAYDEGCFIDEDRGPGDPPEYCYCSYHLCNASQSSKSFYGFTISLLILILVNYLTRF